MKFAALCDWATFRKIFNKYCLDKPHLHRSRTDVILIAEPTGSGGSSMKTVIIYGSCYGTSERYARELARQTGAELHAAKDLRDLTGCGLAVHIGGLYAGGLAGLRQTLRLLPPDCWLMAVTVGLADPALPENVRNIRASLDRQIPPDVRERTLFYHLRGGIRYDRLSLRHRVMMGMLRQTLLRRPAASLTEEDRLLLETYGKEVDFTDLSALEPIAGVILSPNRP